MPRPGTQNSDYPVSLSVQTADGAVRTFRTTVHGWTLSVFSDGAVATVNGIRVENVVDWKAWTHYPETEF